MLSMPFILLFAAIPLYSKYYGRLDFTRLVLFKDLSFVEFTVKVLCISARVPGLRLGVYNKIRLSLTGDLAKLHLFLADNCC